MNHGSYKNGHAGRLNLIHERHILFYSAATHLLTAVLGLDLLIENYVTSQPRHDVPDQET